MSKRRFLKLGFGGAFFLICAPWLAPRRVFASPAIIPRDYLQSDLHAVWMLLSNSGHESRNVRRNLGGILFNMGAIKGQGTGARLGDELAQSLLAVAKETDRPFHSSFELIQALYDHLTLVHRGSPKRVVELGRALFGTLFYVLRGRDGTGRGKGAHRIYQLYREALLDYKDAYDKVHHPRQIRNARATKAALLKAWRLNLQHLAETYARRRMTLNPDFFITADMLTGFRLYIPRQRDVMNPPVDR